jgi:hypothetical protein
VSAQNKLSRNEMLETEDAVVEGAEGQKSVQISEAEYQSLKAAAELTRYPDVLLRTLQAVGRNPGQSLDDAFESKNRRATRRVRSA